MPTRIPTPVVLLMALVALIFILATFFHILSTPLYLLLGLGVATAAISYWSDQLGMKLGKQRITLLGLRPRQTATLISILSSLAIMIVTLAAMLLVYKPLRDALFRFDSERASNKQLVIKSRGLENTIAEQQKLVAERTRRNASLNSALTRQNKTLQLLGDRVGKSQVQLKKANADLLGAEAARRSAETARNEAQAAQSRARSAQSEAERAREDAQSGQAEAQQREVAAQRRTAQAQQRFTQAQSRYTVAQAQLGHAEANLQRAQGDVERAEQELASTRSNLKSTRAQVTLAEQKLIVAERERKVAEQNKVSAERSVAAATRALEIAITEKVKVETELATIKTQLGQVRTQLTQALGLLSDPSTIAVSLNQTLASTTLPSNSSEAEVRATLMDLLSQGRKTARQDGFESLSLVPFIIGEGEQRVELDEDQIIAALARGYLLKADNAYSMRLLAARDHAQDEPEILTRFLAIEVKTAFEKGEVIAETTLEVGQNNPSSDARIFSQLLRLVDQAGRAEAGKRRVVPLLTVETPNFFAPDTNLRIFEAMREIQKQEAGRRVPVKLVAADTLTTIESPRVRFEID